MATYFDVGQKLRRVVDSEWEYGSTAIIDMAARVPQLRSEEYAYQVMRMSDMDDDVRDFILGETAVLMDDGQPLTLGHWMWVFRACSPDHPTENEEQFRRELAWLRRESPSEAVLGHVAQVLDRVHEREQDELREHVRQASRLLDAF